MHFTGLSYLILGLAASVAVEAAPSSRSLSKPMNALVPRGIPEAAQKLRFVPAHMKRGKNDKGNNDNNDNNGGEQDVTINVTDETVDIQEGNTEIKFEEKVTQILIKNRSNNNKKNNKRKDDVKKNNKDQNVVIQVVQVILDVTEGGSGNTRYALSQLLADNGSNSTSTCIMTDAMTMTIGNSSCTLGAVASGASVLVASDAAGTATAVMAMATEASVAAPFNMANGTTLLPAGIAAPAPAEGVMVMNDPAAALAVNDTSSCGF